MRRHWIVVAVVAAAVLVTTTITLISITRNDSVTGSGPTTPASPPAPSPPSTPSGGASSPPVTPAPPPSSPSPAPAAAIPAGLLGEDLELIPTSQAVVALTFDAGANADAVPSILDTLSAKEVPATFFLTGAFASRFPGSVQAITTAGHRIGNHTATHPHCLTLSDAALRDQLTTAREQIRAAGGGDPRPLFRFPFGERDERTVATVNAAGYIPIRWTVDSLGWQGLNGRTERQAIQFIIDRVLGAAQPGEIVLMHVGSHPGDHTTLDAAALPTIVDRLRADGYHFVTLDAVLS